MDRFALPILISILLSFSACHPGENGKDKITVFTSIQPIAYLLDQITTDSVESEVLVRQGYSPASYELLPSQVTAMAYSGLWFKLGHLGYEKAWEQRIAELYPGLVQWDLSGSVKTMSMADIRHGDHSHPGGIDPHIWTGPEEVKNIVASMRKALVSELSIPEFIDTNNFNLLVNRIDSLILDHEQRLAAFKGRRLYLFHPSLGYYCRHFGLEQVAIEDQGKDPSPMHLSAMHDAIANDSVDAILIQREFDQEHAEVIAQSLGIDLIVIDPLQYDWFRMMDEIASAIEKALGASVQK